MALLCVLQIYNYRITNICSFVSLFEIHTHFHVLFLHVLAVIVQWLVCSTCNQKASWFESHMWQP